MPAWPAQVLSYEALETTGFGEAVAEEVGLGGEDRVGLALVLGQLADEGEDLGDVVRSGGADIEFGHALLSGRVGRCGRVGLEPLVEGDGEGEEILLAVEGVDHLDVELGVPESGIVEAAGVVEEIACESAVRVDGGSVEAEVGVVLADLLVHRRMVDGDRDDGELGSHGALGGEEAAVDVLVGRRRDLVVVGGEELDANVLERERFVAVVGDDDTDGKEAVLHVLEAEEAAVLGLVAGLGSDGDVLFGMGVEGGILVGGLGWRSSLVVGCEGRRDKAQDRDRKQRFSQG
jgi:hypothetical protein